MYLTTADIQATIQAIDQEIRLCLVSLVSIATIVVLVIGLIA